MYEDLEFRNHPELGLEKSRVDCYDMFSPSFQIALSMRYVITFYVAISTSAYVTFYSYILGIFNQ